jgi:2-methylcitrate dehydratase
MAGEMGYATPLTAPRWGFQDVVMSGKSIVLAQALGCYTMENILFKVSFPAEFHAQTAAEAAMKLSPSIRDRIDSIREIRIYTQESAVRIIDKKGTLNNPADRDHCIQYIVAVALLHGDLTAEHYEESAASDPRIDHLRDKMTVIEDPSYSRDYLDPNLRSIANRIEVIFSDETTQSAEVHFPLGHRRRRAESRPRLLDKFQANIIQRFDPRKTQAMLQLWDDEPKFWKMRVSEWMDLHAMESPPE